MTFPQASTPSTTSANGGQTSQFGAKPKISTAQSNAAPKVPVQPPPDPKIQAIGFAIELAKVRATAAGPGEKTTDAQRLIDDAKVIAEYIGPKTSVTLR